jgi:hypothetical protein
LKLQKLCGNIKLRVYGHVKDRIPGVTTRVKPGDVVKIGETNVGVVTSRATPTGTSCTA